MHKLLFLLALSLLSTSKAHPPIAISTTLAGADVQVVMHITGLDDTQLSRLASEVGRDRALSLEYSCAWSGVVVLKYTDVAVTERADAITMTRRLLAKAAIEQQVEFLHITLELRGPGKC
ncbi:MAG TPA: hypothetical protein PL070_15295 [Flavobacteriales bacterium]|nr:hypothetical protein [Flavobacteriales bacterium]